MRTGSGERWREGAGELRVRAGSGQKERERESG